MHADVEMCAKLALEGIGSLYERMVLRDFLAALVQQEGITSVLEYDCRVTKGYDNIALLPHAEVAMAVATPQTVERVWPFSARPRIVDLNAPGSYDLVWSFAVAQVDPRSVERMRQASREWVLVFVPNALNWGAPFHWALHRVTRTACRHAEHRERFRLGTLRGMRHVLASLGMTVCRSGYIDKPWLPDIGFSKRELRELLGRGRPREQEPASPERLAAAVERLRHFEGWPLPGVLQALVAHHLYVLGRLGD